MWGVSRRKISPIYGDIFSLRGVTDDVRTYFRENAGYYLVPSYEIIN